MTSDNTPRPNRLTKQEILERMDILGAQAGMGKDTQVKAGLSMVEGAYLGELDLMPNKNGTDIDDATLNAERYYKAQSGATTFDAKAGNQRKLISCFRTLVKAGGKSGLGNGEPIATLDRLLLDRRNELRKDPLIRPTLDDAFNGLMKMARTIIKSDVMPSDSELEQLLYKSSREPATAEEKLTSLRDGLQHLANGDKNGQRDNSKEVKEAIKLLTDRIVDIAHKKRGQK